MILADKIIALRKKNGWSQEDLAEQLNVSRQSVSKWEGAQSVPDLERILQLARVFGVSTDYLLKDEMEAEEYTEDPEVPERRRVSMAEASEFLQLKWDAARRIAQGVYLCILSPICLILLGAGSEMGRLPISEDMAGGVGLIILFLLIATAVAIFISSGAKTDRFDFLEKETFETEYGVAGMVRERRQQYRETYTRYNVIGTVLCILSVIPLFIGAALNQDDFFMALMLSLLLTLAGLGVVFFIIGGTRWSAMQILLQDGDYNTENKRKTPLLDAFGSAFWLLTTAVYLFWSFRTDNWEQTWIVWPIAGVLYAAVYCILDAIEKKKK